MSGDLVLVRMLVVSSLSDDRERLRLAASTSPIPTEVIEADGVSAASDALTRGVDLMLLDGALPAPSRAVIVAAAQACSAPPLIILLAIDTDQVAAKAATDGVVLKPRTKEEATAFVERCTRMRLPSRVLVVDDSSTMRSIVRKILSASRFRMQVEEASEGIAALKQIASGHFELVILDYQMPGLNGLETLSEIKRKTPQVSVVLMTSGPDDALAERARAAGAAAFLRKPFYATDIDLVMCGVFGLRKPAQG